MDPLGLVTVRQRLNPRPSNCGRYYVPWNTRRAWHECHCSDNGYRMRLFLEYSHDYICDGTKGNCNIEAWHANIAWVWVVKNAKRWDFAETLVFTSEESCDMAGAKFAAQLESGANDFTSDPDYRESQEWFESTHSPFPWNPCSWFLGGPCGAYHFD